ncbi:MAG: hypothetical protein QM708_12055 [Propioniciclava sp.]|uniref:phage tail tube protein n=1 Tax=Propioniciclava sp. TaxID=2038686 RepID=UPI0039E42701
MPNKNNVVVGKPKVAGAIFRAPAGTALPTDATAPLAAAYKELGYASSDGWGRQIEKAFETIAAWGGDEVKRSRTEHSVGVTVTLIENLNEATQTAKWGTAAVTVTPANATHGKQITVAYAGDDTPSGVWVFDMYDEGRLHRTVFPDAQDTTESFEQTFSDGSPIGLPFELTAYRDPITGKYFYDYLDDGKKTA